ncbi:carboxypeptidase S [Auriscalpium vulgare]|uniref:Carboxypeptidase S n=1 Tax=Auriscalpium vulgare TaxID=40419 RepID=A0ACB8RSK7_9AGAM|nr:carboxypeptidase S [Auriscalpium vulgare]
MDASGLCPQVDPLYPSRSAELWTRLSKTYLTEAFTLRAVDQLGGAVRVPTESYDGMGPVGEDSRWEAFQPFHDYLFQTFPLVHSVLTVTKVNTYALIYEWKGTNDSAKPLLLAAHQDVVPVDPTSIDDWTHPPYSGHYDGKLLWGRGSSDDKAGLIGILSSVESLLESNFTPTRSVVLTFGIDEESSGRYGAAKLAEHLLHTFGENAFALLVDEGGGFQESDGTVFATTAIAEKGYFDTLITVATPGGHSSIPPPHTSIGILARLLVELEVHPPPSHLERGTPVYDMAQCIAAHAQNVDPALRSALKASMRSDRALHAAEKMLFKDRDFASLAGTTQAVDLVWGGVKTNALPEEAWAIVNHRIATQRRVSKYDTELFTQLAHEFNLTYTAFDVPVTPTPGRGTLTLSDAWNSSLAPAPTTPTDALPYRLLSGTIRATYNSWRGLDPAANSIFVSPGVMGGNTDTQFYWKLTPHIVRYNHKEKDDGPKSGVHTVDEFIPVKHFVEMISFFTMLILNADEATNL